MAVNVETLEKLERKITLNLPVETIRDEVNTRLKRLARQVKIDGFRPGKVPMNIVAQRYGYSVHYEVMNDKVGEAFNQAANEAQLRVAGQPRINEAEGAPEGQMAFEAIFEVYPDVKIADLSTVEIERVTSDVTDAAIDKTIDILRKQRRTFAQRSLESQAADGDRVSVDFIGKIDGEPFEGGKADDFQFIVGEGQMLKEFEDAVRGMKVGDSRTFPLSFPADYHGKDVAGKTADFLVTLKKLEASHEPEVTDELAKSLGVTDGSVAGLRADIRKNLEREVKNRLLDKAPIPEEIFRPQAEKRVRMGLVVAELVRTHNLSATAEQIKAHIEDLASSYEKPEDVVRWYYQDMNRLGEVEAMVVENNVTQHVLAKVKVKDKSVSFDELMGQS